MSKPRITIEKSDKFPVRKYKTQEDFEAPKFMAVYRQVVDAIKVWKESFVFIDRYRKGWVVVEDLRLILQRHEVELDPQEFAELSSLFTVNGRFNYVTFLREVRQYEPSPHQADLTQLRQMLRTELEKRNISPTIMFLKFDTNNNGAVSADEFIAFYKSIGITLQMKYVRSLIGRYSKDPNGLSYKAFSNMLLGAECGDEEAPMFTELAWLLLSKQHGLLEFLEETDGARSGFVTEGQFAQAMLTFVAFMTEAEARSLFQILAGSDKLFYWRVGPIVNTTDPGQLSPEQLRIFEGFKEEFFDEDELLLATLQEMDADSDGFITFEELSQAIKQLNFIFEEDKLEPIFSVIDKRGTGKVRIDEFVTALQLSLWK